MKTRLLFILGALIISHGGNAHNSDKKHGTQVKHLAKSSQSWDGTPLPSYPSAKPEITILNIKIPPGTRLPLHRHPVINAGYLIKGELTVVKEDGKKRLKMKAGDTLIELVNQWHYGKNEGKTTAEIVVFYAGSSGQEITVKKK